MSDTKLKPCPFCGGEVEFHAQEHHMNNFWNKNTIYCNNCDFRMESTSRIALFNRWNTRKPMDDIVGKLEELHEYYINRDGIVGGNIGALAIKNAIEIVKECGTDGNSTTDN